MKRIKQRKMSTNVTETQAHPFMGEIMTCCMCGKVEKSDPLRESDWTAIDVDSVRRYICPSCFGNVPSFVFTP